MTDLDLSTLSDKVDLSVEGLLNHQLNVLRVLTSLAATVGQIVKVELRLDRELENTDVFAISGEDGVWVAFTYEEGVEFLSELVNEACKGGPHGP